MSYCPNCGRQLADGEVCTCQAAAAEPKKKSKKGLVIAVLILILCVAAGVAVFLLVTNSYKKPINSLTSVINDRETNIDKIAAAALPDFASSSYTKAMKILKTSEEVEEAYGYGEEALEELYEQLDDLCGEGWKVKFDYSDKEKLEAEELEDISSGYSRLYDYYFEDICDEIEGYDKYDYEDMGDSLGITASKAKDLAKIVSKLMEEFEDIKATEGYVLTGRLILSDASGKTVEKSDKISVQIIKLNGDWTIDYMSLFNDFGYGISNLIWELEDIIDEFY